MAKIAKELQEMFDAAVHIGHRTQKWNPRMGKYLYGEKNGIHLINLEQTSALFDNALTFLSKLSGEGKKVLIVSTKPQSLTLVKELAGNCSIPYVVSKWIPGLLTNFKTVKTRIKYLIDLKSQRKNGDFDKYTKKEASKLTKTIDKLQVALGGVESLKSLPDAVFVVDVVRDAIVVKEANKLGIPVVGFVDSNSDPLTVTYPVPANDDALKSLAYLLGRVEGVLKSKTKSKPSAK